MKPQLRQLGRGSFARLTAGVVSTAMLASVSLAVGAPASAATTTQATTNKTVLANEYGKAKSHIEGTFGKSGTVRGTFTPRKFKVSDAGVLKAVGRLKATLVRGNGDVVGTTTQRVKLPVQVPGASTARTAGAQAITCDILKLLLGPLDLDLLGLQVHLDKVVLNIIAASGAGNLLGNLLCAVAGLLDQGGLLTQVSQILNSILAILRL